MTTALIVYAMIAFVCFLFATLMIAATADNSEDWIFNILVVIIGSVVWPLAILLMMASERENEKDRAQRDLENFE